MSRKSKVKRFSKINYGKGQRHRSAIFLIAIYSIVFIVIAIFSYLMSMAVNSYLKRPHCKEITPLPESNFENGDGKKVVEVQDDRNLKPKNNKETNNFDNRHEVEQGNKENVNRSINGVEVGLKTLYSNSEFEKFLEAAKSSGKNAVIVCLKGRDGRIVYDSELKLAEKWRTVFFKKIIDFGEIAKKIRDMGLIPIARMSAFFDQTAPSVDLENTFIREQCRSEKVGVNVFGEGDGFKRGKWLDPTNSSVRKYIIGLAIEMTNLGFENVLIDNAFFPPFKSNYEIENFENNSHSEDTRYRALLSFVNDLNSSGVKLIFSYPGSVFYDSKLSKSLFGKLDLLKKIKVHAPIFRDVSEVKKCENILLELANSLIFVPEIYSKNSKSKKDMLSRFESYEINSSLIVN